MATRRELGIPLLDLALQEEPKMFLTGRIIVQDPQNLDKQISSEALTTSYGLAPEFTRLGRLANRIRIALTKRDTTGILGTPEQRKIQISLRKVWEEANKPTNKQKLNVVIFDRHTLAQSL